MAGLVCTAGLRMYLKGIAASLQDATVSNLRIRRRGCQSRRLRVALIIQLRIDRRTGMLQVVGQKIICRIQSIGDQNQYFRLGLFAPVSMLLMCRPVICIMFLSWFGTDWDTVRFQTLHALYTKSFRVNTQKYDEFHLLSMAQCGTIDSSKKCVFAQFYFEVLCKNGDIVRKHANAGEHRFKNVDITYDACTVFPHLLYERAAA